MMNPYPYSCPIHGSGHAEIDECPKCLEQSLMEADARGNADYCRGRHLCLTCSWHEYDCGCFHPKLERFNRTDRGTRRERKCKYYTPDKGTEGNENEMSVR